MEKSEQNQSEQQQYQDLYLNLASKFNKESYISYQLAQSQAHQALLEQERFRELNPVVEMSIDEYERFLRAEKAIFSMFHDALELGAKALGIESILEELNKRKSE